LSEAERRQRSEAGKASARARRAGHPGETAPSVRQGSTGAPSRAAVGLFRQGQARGGTRAGRSVWDTRTTEAPVGSINARFRLHFPDAYRSPPGEQAPRQKGRPLVAEMLSEAPATRGGKIAGARYRAGASKVHRDLVVENPEVFVEAMRHPKMRAVLQHAVGVVREHQAGAIERGYEKGLIPKDTPRSVASRAFKHASLLALHRAGVGDYDFKMDTVARRQFRPLERFMRYAHRRTFDRLHTEAPSGAFEPFKQQFGHKFRSRKHGKLTGTERYRMRPNERLVKLAKSWTNATGVVRSPGRGPTDQGSARPDGLLYRVSRLKRLRKIDPRGTQVSLLKVSGTERVIGTAVLPGLSRRLHARMAKGSSAQRGTEEEGHRTVLRLDVHAPRSITTAAMPVVRFGDSGAETSPGLRKTTGGGLAMSAMPSRTAHGSLPRLDIPASEETFSRIAGASRALRFHPKLHVKHAARRVERHLLGKTVPIAFAAQPDPELRKVNASFPLSNPYSEPSFGNYSSSPALLLRRAMRPRMHRRRMTLRLNTQRGLRHALGGGVTRQERWQLGAGRGFGKIEGAYSAGFYPEIGPILGNSLEKVFTGIAGSALRLGARAARGVGRGASRAGREGVATVRQHGVKSALAPGMVAGRMAGAGVGGARGAKIGGHIGLASDYVPLAYTAYRAGRAVKPPKPEQGQVRKGVIGNAMQFGRGLSHRVFGHPRVAAAMAEAEAMGGFLPKSKGYRLGRMVGAGIGGERGARIGGHIGRTAGLAPTAALAGGLIVSEKKRREALQQKVQEFHAATAPLLGKAFGIKTAGRVVGAVGRGIAGATRRHPATAGVLAGAAAIPAVHHLQQHPAERAAVGAIAGGALAAALSRGRARGKLLASMAPMHRAKVVRAGVKVRASRKAVAAGAALGGATALTAGLLHRHNRWADLPNPANP
jgi:hypothetical protein